MPRRSQYYDDEMTSPPGTDRGSSYIFDFRRPDRIPQSQIGAIQRLHEQFARTLAANLTAHLRSAVTVTASAIDQISYAEFIGRLPSPTCLITTTLTPFSGNAVLEINPALAMTVLQLILGGKGMRPASFDRTPTEIEQHLLEILFRLVVNDLKNAWKSTAPMEFQWDTVSTEPQVVQVLTPSEAVVAITFRATVHEVTGEMHLAIPSSIMKMLRMRFDQHGNLRRAERSEEDQQRALRYLRGASVELDAHLSELNLRIEDLLRMQVGDVVGLDYPIDRPVEVSVNGIAKYRGVIGENRQHRCIQITGLQDVKADVD